MSAPRLVRPLLLVVVPVVLLVPLAACGAGDGEEAEASSTTAAAPSEPTTAVAVHATTVTTEAPAPTTTEPPTEEEAILAAVDGFWTAVRESSEDPPNPDHPGLREHAAGPALAAVLASLEKKLLIGQATRLPEASLYGHTLEISQIDGDLAVVADCGVDDAILFDAASGRTLNDLVVTNLWTITLTLTDTGWKVVETDLVRQWEGATDCTG